jgi:hypothetical protein
MKKWRIVFSCALLLSLATVVSAETETHTVLPNLFPFPARPGS